MSDLVPNVVVAIEGYPKTGKTHLSCTFPDPIKIFSFDIGAEFVAGKFPDKQIDIVDYPLPVLDTLHPEPYALKFWKQIRQDLYKVFEEAAYKTINIDTTSALFEVMRQAYAEELGQTQLMQWQYGEPNARMKGVIDRAHVSGVNLVLTHYLRERYVKGEPTGELELEGMRKTAGLADIVLRTERVASAPTPEQKRAGYKQSNKIVTTITDCRFDLALCGYSMENCTYDDLIALLGLG